MQDNRLMINDPKKDWLLKQLLYKGVLAELHDHFVAMNVNYMPIKGAYLILSGIAETIPQRRMADIDILLTKKDFDSAMEYFGKCKKALLRKDEWAFEQPFTYTFGAYKINVELHYLLNRPERFLLTPEELFERGTELKPGLFIPSKEDGLFITIAHSLVHIAFLFREESVLGDIKAISSLVEFDWEKFWRIVEKAGIKDFVAGVLLLYNKKCDGKIVIKKIRIGVKARWLAWWLRDNRWEKMPILGRRVLLEVLFVRDWWGMCYKGRKNYLNKYNTKNQAEESIWKQEQTMSIASGVHASDW
jgi:hypothetical protein